MIRGNMMSCIFWILWQSMSILQKGSKMSQLSQLHWGLCCNFAGNVQNLAKITASKDASWVGAPPLPTHKSTWCVPSSNLPVFSRISIIVEVDSWSGELPHWVLTEQLLLLFLPPLFDFVAEVDWLCTTTTLWSELTTATCLTNLIIHYWTHTAPGGRAPHSLGNPALDPRWYYCELVNSQLSTVLFWIVLKTFEIKIHSLY